MSRTRIFYIFLVMLLSAGITAQAQGKKQKKNTKTAVEKKTAEQPENTLYEEMLSSTAKVMFIDSLVADKNDYLSKIPLNKESGTVAHNEYWNKENQTDSYIYINEFGNKAFFSKKDKDGFSKLYSADKLNGQWSTPKLINDFDDEFTDINNPYMMSDGITLYFSAKGQETLGGYDIYMTMYDADSARFYKPENLGLPYNSTSNDYYCIIDDFDAIGWLVTDRNQSEGKVCIYTFVPTAEREIYDETNTEEDKLRSLADIRSIKDTWTDNNKVQAAKSRIEKLLQRRNSMGRNSISFVVNDNTVYTKPEDFKIEANRAKFTKLTNAKKEAQALTDSLERLRMKYSEETAAGKKKLSALILSDETKLSRLSEYIHSLEKEIRNTENLKTNNK